jgi:Fic family protein
MPSPHEKLAESLQVLKTLQDRGVRVFQASALPALTRVHRERLLRAGFLKLVIKGWYLANNPEDADGDSTHWYANMEAFVAAYATSRFGRDWQLGAELSVLKHSGHTSIAKQLQIQAPAADNQPQPLPFDCSVFFYRIPAAQLVPGRVPDASGMLLMPLPDALIRLSPTFFAQHEMSAQIAMRQVEITQLVEALLAGGHSVVAGRLVGALQAVGREAEANQLLLTMRAAGFAVAIDNPFEQPLAQMYGGRNESPYVMRIRAMWSAMRETVVHLFEAVPRAMPVDADALISDITARYVADAYHSLSIEGYRVSAELVEKVRTGQWSPETHPEDRRTRDAMAAKGYAETHVHVKALIERVVRNSERPADVFGVDFFRWYLTLFSPSVQAGILKAADLAGYRNNQVFIRNALHVPPAPEAVRDCMPALMELLAGEAHPGVRAVLGHFIFVFIHPYMDGNGRLSRFIMNFMLTTGGYPWTIVTVQSRKAYLAALEQASTHQNIEPFASFICDLIATQANAPVERITQRPESGSWTEPSAAHPDRP